MPPWLLLFRFTHVYYLFHHLSSHVSDVPSLLSLLDLKYKLQKFSPWRKNVVANSLSFVFIQENSLAGDRTVGSKHSPLSLRVLFHRLLLLLRLALIFLASQLQCKVFFSFNLLGIQHFLNVRLQVFQQPQEKKLRPLLFECCLSPFSLFSHFVTAT